MAESITISNSPPTLKSMQYDFLRKEGLKYIEQLASKIWTDYNESDPGITMLEALSYAITDLGYRSNYSIPDILAQNPNDPQIDIKNFYTAREILPMCPVTFSDYRELMIDVEVHDPGDEDCPFAGVKNAWIEKSPDNEIPVYRNSIADELSYIPVDPANPDQIDIKVLYNVLLEFDRCENLGDLNENTIEQRINLYQCPPQSPPIPPLDPALSGISVDVQVEFASWDEPIDWNDTEAIKASIQNILLDFSQLPIGYTIQGYGLLPDKSIWLSITKGANNVPVDTQCIIQQLEVLIYGLSNADNFLIQYQRKIFKILEIVAEVRKKLMANRNLCEDFFRINALKVEEIALCADIVVTTNSDIEEILAQIYFEIGNFLAPTVNFYTLSEMYDKGYKTEEIFEGPKLEHGFIDPAELKQADRKENIHVSDLYQIIMDVPGVEAINNLQIANIPLNNTDNIPSVSVKWCLELAFDKNYVPRLSAERSSVTFFKEQLPYSANEAEVDQILEQLISEQPPQKLHNIQLDLPVPEGTYKDISNYVSVQNEFPLVYGTGEAGLPESATTLRKAQAKQLKGFLMFFDQLLADYLSQLDNVRNLFSMNGERDANGNFVIDKTYFSQSLIPYVPDVLPLLVNASEYPEDLQEITENEELFDERRNRFLDHLMARFSEQFTDYALLVYQLNGKKAPDELLEDKLKFLDEYPAISGGRFKAFNYESPCELWHVNNVSGLEKRISLLTGINPEKAEDLVYKNDFLIASLSPGFAYKVTLNLSNALKSVDIFDTEDDTKKAIEELIINAVCPEKYVITDAQGNIITKDDRSEEFYIKVICNEKFLATSQEFDSFPDLTSFIDLALPVFNEEYYNNPESNRHNLTCPLFNYFNCVDPVVVNMVPDAPVYYLMFDFFEHPFIFDDTNEKLLTGAFVSDDNEIASVEIIDVDDTASTITVANNLTSQLPDGVDITITGSTSNDGTYTVASAKSLTQDGILVTIVELAGSPTLSESGSHGSMEFIIQTAFKGYGACKTLEAIQSVNPDPAVNTITVNGDLSPWIAVGDPVSIDGSADNNGDYTVDTITINVISPTETETILKLEEGLISAVLPLGNLKYNEQSAQELIDQVTEQKEEILFEIAQRGINTENYGFTDYQVETYRFFIEDKCGDPIANAVETDYNEALKDAIINQPSSQITIVNSTANDGTYTVIPASTETQGSQIKISISGTIPSLVADGQVQISESGFAVDSVNTAKREFVVDTDLSRKIFPGDTFDITGSDDNDGTYTATDLNYDPNSLKTTITVEETIESSTGTLGNLDYTKLLDIQFVVQNTDSEIYVKGGADIVAVDQTAKLLRELFFSHEGLHILEHVLLRPKYNEDIYINFSNGATPLDDSISTLGDFTFMKKLEVDSVDAITNSFLVAGDITSELSGLVLDSVFIKGSDFGINDGEYKLLSSSFDGTFTNIKVYEDIPSDSLSDFGDFIYQHTVAIDAYPSTTSVAISVPDAEISTGFPVSISNSEDDINNGNYQIDPSVQIISPTETEVVLLSREMLISDDLLQINTKSDCITCELKNPYSFIMTVVLPAWQGRFTNQDFRSFFERSFRLECPAHLVPNICWIDCKQMDEFERTYKKWLLENSKVNKNPLTLSKALNELIEVLGNLRSIYPQGTLHDCNIDDTIDNAIILNRTEIGTN